MTSPRYVPVAYVIGVYASFLSFLLHQITFKKHSTLCKNHQESYLLQIDPMKSQLGYLSANDEEHRKRFWSDAQIKD